MGAMAHPPSSTRTLRLSDREVLLDRRVVVRDNQELDELTPLEASLLSFLAARPGQTVDRKILLREVWGYAEQVNSRAVDKTVHRLRQKLEPDPAEPRHLLGQRALGYRLALGEPAPPRPGELVAEAEALDLKLRHGEARVARPGLLARAAALLQLVDDLAEANPDLAARALLALQAVQIRTDAPGFARRCERVLARARDPWRHRLRAGRAEAALFLGRMEEAVRDCERILAEAPPEEAVARAHALLVLAISQHWEAGDPERIVRHLQEGLEALAGRDEPRLETRVTIAMCRHYLRLGRYEVVVRAAGHCVAVLERSGDLELLGVALNHLAAGLAGQECRSEAIARNEEALAVFREAGDRAGASATLVYLLNALIDQGRLPEAQRYQEEARALAVETGNKTVLAVTHEGAGMIALELGLLEQARHHFRLYARLGDEVGNPMLGAGARGFLSLLAHLEGDLEEAREQLAPALATSASLVQPMLQRWLMLLQALRAAETADRPAMEQARDLLRSKGTSGWPRELAWQEAILALAERVGAAVRGELADPERDALNASLEAFVAAQPRDQGHEPRLLALLLDAIRRRVLP